jgi:hypothetical protein
LAFDKLISHNEPIRDLEINMVINSKEKILVNLIANITNNGDSRIFCLVRDATQRKMERDRELINKQKKKDKLMQKVREIRNQLQKLL